MKRSKSIRLVLIGSVGMMALGGCSSDEQSASGPVFLDAAQCSRENDAAACQQALADAQAAHAKTAPAFATREACEAKFGAANCAAGEGAPSAQQFAAGETPQPTTEAQASSGMGFFMPMLLGYTMGNMIGGRAVAQPVWRDGSNNAYVGGRATGKIDPASLARGTPARITRGGFGGSAFGSSTS